MSGLPCSLLLDPALFSPGERVVRSPHKTGASVSILAWISLQRKGLWSFIDKQQSPSLRLFWPQGRFPCPQELLRHLKCPSAPLCLPLCPLLSVPLPPLSAPLPPSVWVRQQNLVWWRASLTTGSDSETTTQVCGPWTPASLLMDFVNCHLLMQIYLVQH